MKHFPRLARIGALALLAAAASACTTYTIRHFDDHHAQPVTQLETNKINDMYIWATFEHQFWLCEDAGDQLICERRCGEGTDLTCPAAAMSGAGITTNAR